MNIDGYHNLQELIELAWPKKIYDKLAYFEPEEGLAVTKERYSMLAVARIISVGTTLMPVFISIFDLLTTVALFVFLFDNRALANAAYEIKVKSCTGRKKAERLLYENGDRLPDIGLKSNLYVIKSL